MANQSVGESVIKSTAKFLSLFSFRAAIFLFCFCMMSDQAAADFPCSNPPGGLAAFDFTSSVSSGGVGIIDFSYNSWSSRIDNTISASSAGGFYGHFYIPCTHNVPTHSYYYYNIPSSGDTLSSHTMHDSYTVGWAIIKKTSNPPPKNLGRRGCWRELGCVSGFADPDVGNPINSGTGNKFLEEKDYLGASYTGLEFTRYFNSYALKNDVGIGINWTSTYHRFIRNLGGGVVHVTAADGRTDTFKQVSGVWTSDTDVLITLAEVVDAGGTQTGWKVTRPTDSAEYYDLKGRLTSIVDRNGRTTTLAYDSDGRLSTVTGPFGHTLTFAYNSYDEVSQITAPDSSTYSYVYDSSRRLTSVTYPGGAVRQYTYGSLSYAYALALTGIIDENGNQYATYTYNSTSGKALTSQHAGGADLTTITYGTNKATIKDARNNTFVYNFATSSDTILLMSATGVPYPYKEDGSKAFTYDTNGFLASKTDFNDNVTTYTRDARGLELSRTEASGTALSRTITTTWHAQFHLPTQLDEPGRTTTFSYDTSGNLLTKTASSSSGSSTWAYTYNSSGQVLTEDGPRTDVSDIKTYAYNTNGSLASITDALSHVTSFTSYDNAGRPLSYTDPNGLVTTLAYNGRGSITSVTKGGIATTFTYDPAEQLTRITQPDGSYISYTYDAAHRLTGIADNLNNHIVYTLDAAGNRTAEQVYDPNDLLVRSRTHTYDTVNRLATDVGAASQTTTYGYDTNDNPTSVTNPLSYATTRTFDALNRLVQITKPGSNVTQIGYNSNDLVTTVTDPKGLVTTYGYDGLGNLTSIQSPDTGTTTKTYDAAGNVITSTDAKGQTTTYAYDALNRRTSAALSGGTTITYQYDQGTYGIGHLTGMTDPAGSTTWTYDQHGRLTQKQQVTGSVTLTIGYGYDSYGRLSSMTYPSGKVVSYSYASNGRISTITSGGINLLSQIAYMPLGPVSSWSEGNGGSYGRGFDADGQITSIGIVGATTRTLIPAYDAASHVASITDTGATTGMFGYDALDRLISYSATPTTQAYTYDADGNRTNLTGNEGSVDYGYDVTTPSNRLLSLSGSMSRTNSYDSNGSLTGDGSNGYGYDTRGRMVSSTASAITTNYGLNGLGQRVSKSGSGVEPNGTRLFAYDEAGHLVGEYDGSTGEAIEETVWLNDLPVAILTGSGTGAAAYYVHPDHLGAPKVINDGSGNTVWAWEHDPFGNGQPSGTFTYNLRYPGQYYDSESNLNYNMNRDYDPVIGRYIQSDPIGLRGGVNTYGYANQNPMWSVDPMGLLDENMIPTGEALRNQMENIPSKLDAFSVGAHGSANAVFDEYGRGLTARELADRINKNQKYRKGMPVELYSCNTGSKSNGFAQNLADILQVPVTAPDKFLWNYPDGSNIIAGAKGENSANGMDLGNIGAWQSFYPSTK